MEFRWKTSQKPVSGQSPDGRQLANWWRKTLYRYLTVCLQTRKIPQAVAARVWFSMSGLRWCSYKSHSVSLSLLRQELYQPPFSFIGHVCVTNSWWIRSDVPRIWCFAAVLVAVVPSHSCRTTNFAALLLHRLPRTISARNQHKNLA